MTRKQKGNSKKAILKKVFYNRVRRCCRKHGLDLVFDGEHRNYRAVQLLKDGQLLFGDYATDLNPLDIDWKKIHEGLVAYGFRGGVK